MNLWGEDLDQVPNAILPVDGTLDAYLQHWATFGIPCVGLPHIKRVVAQFPSARLLDILQTARRNNHRDCRRDTCRTCEAAQHFNSFLDKYIARLQKHLLM